MGSSYTQEMLEEAPRKPFIFGDSTPVTLYSKAGKLYADVQLYDALTRRPVTLKHNELHDKPPSWDMNSNNKAIEVVDQNNRPVFQLMYKTPTHIAITGMFAMPTGALLCDDHTSMIGPSPDDINSFVLKPIFKHPAWKYPGQYE
jgi:hypothetical protein